MQKTTRPAMPCAGAALTEDMEVRVFLLERGVEVGQKGHDVPEGKDNLEALLTELMACGLEVQVCGLCMSSCSLEEKDTSDDIVRGPMKPLAGWVKSSGRVLTF
jgi:sulfur relay (sulfurtransferase) complex TusBCD TusD component (DsrE family)